VANNPFFRDTVASPLTTPEQAHLFLTSMRHKSKKEEWEHRPPTNLSSDGVDAWYMMQRNREQEMRKRRQEAAQLLQGWRGAYRGDDTDGSNDFGSWSPRARPRGRASFGDVSTESLIDPESPGKRRQSTMPRLQHNWGEEISVRDDCIDEERERTPMGPERSSFLYERQHFDGTQYPKFDERTAFSDGRALFLEDYSQDGFEEREPGAPYNPARYIDTTESQNRLRQARSTEGKSRYSMESGRETFDPSRYSTDSGREGVDARQAAPVDTNPAYNDTASEVPETVWRDFISPGKSTHTTEGEPLVIVSISNHLPFDRAWSQVPARSWTLPLVRIVCLSRIS
jgi:hypothetical protein